MEGLRPALVRETKDIKKIAQLKPGERLPTGN
jgi:hypothetical protein